jgi:small ligand-binding sensory domain FIST
MRFASATSEHPTLELALTDATNAVMRDLALAPHVVWVFVTPDFGRDLDRLPGMLASAFPGAIVLGCGARGVVGAGAEFETGPALSLFAGHLPDVELNPFHVAPGESPLDAICVDPDLAPAMVLTPDPFSAAREMVQALDEAYPRSVKVGGLTSGGGQEPGSGLMFLNGVTFRDGMVGISMHGDVEVDPVIAQGCRGLGSALVATRVEQHAIYELDGVPVVDALEREANKWDRFDLEVFRRSPMIGLGVGADRYLVRNVLTLDRERGTLLVGARVEEGTRVRFHVRDRAASSADLKRQLQPQVKKRPAAGGMLFTCLGRGQGFFGEPNHDASMIAEQLGPVPVAGFFCNGEIGPVRGTTHLHGYTASIALFRSCVWD